MSDDLATTPKPAHSIQIVQLFQQLSETAIDLRIVEKFFSELERRMLQSSTLSFDIEPIKTYLHQLKSFSEETPSTEVTQVEFSLKHELQNWRSLLAKRDEKIETYHFRRFCDSGKEPLDNVVFSALTRFYRDTLQTPLSRSKFDLTVTRLFTKERNVTRRQANLNRDELALRLQEMFDQWDGTANMFEHLADETKAVVAKIDEFIAETQSLEKFEELVKNNLFDRFRDFKRDLGEKFFEPTIVAASIECNLAVGNAFHQLLGNANENLNSKLISTFDFAEAFHDTSPNAQLHTSELLHEFKLHETSDGTTESEELLFIWELLESVSSDNPSGPQSNPENISLKDHKSASKSLPPQDRVAALLATIQEIVPNTKLLRDYMHNSKLLNSIDLNDFLHSPNEQVEQICREALSLIIWSAEIQENELTNPTNLPLTIRDEVKTILRKSQSLAEQLGLLVEISDQATQNRLLLVSNKLLETSFKVERAIVRFSNRNLGHTKTDEEKTEVKQTSKPVFVLKPQQPVKPRANRWLAAATILISLLSSSLYFYNQQVNDSIPPSQTIEKVDHSMMPKGEHLSVVFRRKNTLIVTAKSSWKEISKDEQAETMQIWVNVPSQPKLDTVIVFDEEGQLLADLSPNGISFDGNPQIAEAVKK